MFFWFVHWFWRVFSIGANISPTMTSTLSWIISSLSNELRNALLWLEQHNQLSMLWELRGLVPMVLLNFLLSRPKSSFHVQIYWAIVKRFLHNLQNSNFMKFFYLEISPNELSLPRLFPVLSIGDIQVQFWCLLYVLSTLKILYVKKAGVITGRQSFISPFLEVSILCNV